MIKWIGSAGLAALVTLAIALTMRAAVHDEDVRLWVEFEIHLAEMIKSRGQIFLESVSWPVDESRIISDSWPIPLPVPDVRSFVDSNDYFASDYFPDSDDLREIASQGITSSFPANMCEFYSMTCPINWSSGGHSAPDFPQRARELGIDGYVILEFDVDQHGVVRNVQVVESSNPIFDASAVRTIGTWRFQPQLDDQGNPITVSGQRTLIEFVLEEDE